LFLHQKVQSTLDEECRQAEEPKQLVDEAPTLCGHLLWRFAIQPRTVQFWFSLIN